MVSNVRNEDEGKGSWVMISYTHGDGRYLVTWPDDRVVSLGRSVQEGRISSVF